MHTDKDTNKDIHTHTHTAYSALDIPIFAKAYEFYKRLTLAIAAFPKTKRYTLGQKLDNITLEILELLFSVPVAQNKILALQQISIKLDLLKVLLRIAKDIQAISNKNYLELETILQEIGRMLGGWIRAVKQSSP